MVLDMGPLLRGEIKEMSIDYMLTPEPVSQVTFEGDAHVVGRLTDQAGYMCLTLKASVGYETLCARCLASVRRLFEVQFDRVVVSEGTLTEEQLEDHIDEYVVIENGQLDVDEQLREAMILLFPTRVLCSEDCPGLCPKCGKPLAEGPCGCVLNEPDPRWAVLRSLRLDDEQTENEKEQK